jgi:putative membrane protein
MNDTLALPLTVHMVAHMAMVAVAAPALAWIVGGSRIDPVRRRPRWFSPIPASLLEFTIVWAWHAPVLHLAARHHAGVFAAEQLSFFIVALWLWLSIFGGGPQHRLARAGSGVIALVLTFAHMTMLGAVVALSPRVLYDHGALVDQQYAGTVMIASATAAYLGGALWLSRALLLTPSRERRA